MSTSKTARRRTACGTRREQSGPSCIRATSCLKPFVYSRINAYQNHLKTIQHQSWGFTQSSRSHRCFVDLPSGMTVDDTLASTDDAIVRMDTCPAAGHVAGQNAVLDESDTVLSRHDRLRPWRLSGKRRSIWLDSHELHDPYERGWAIAGIEITTLNLGGSLLLNISNLKNRSRWGHVRSMCYVQYCQYVPG